MSRDNLWFEIANGYFGGDFRLFRTVATPHAAAGAFCGAVYATIPSDGTATGVLPGGLAFEKSSGTLYKNAGTMSSCRFIPFEGGSGGTTYENIGVYGEYRPSDIDNARLRITRDCTLVGAYAAWKSVSHTAGTVIDVFYSRDQLASWTSVFSTKLTVDVHERTSDTAATPYVFSTTALLAGDYLRFYVESYGTGNDYLSTQVRVSYP